MISPWIQHLSHSQNTAAEIWGTIGTFQAVHWSAFKVIQGCYLIFVEQFTDLERMVVGQSSGKQANPPRAMPAFHISADWF